MKKQKIHFLIIPFVILVMVVACSEKKFEKTGWMAKSDAGMPPEEREEMLGSLLSTYKVVGMKSEDIITLLGEPDDIDSISLSYNIKMDYGFDIDPVYTKDLYFLMTKDSIVSSYEIKEWRKESVQ